MAAPGPLLTAIPTDPNMTRPVAPAQQPLQTATQSPLSSFQSGQNQNNAPPSSPLSSFGQQSPFNTQLPPLMESQFQQWAGNNNLPVSQPGSPTPYDLRGLFDGIQNNHPQASGFNPSSGQFPSYWATPLHNGFSDQSKFAEKPFVLGRPFPMGGQ